MSLHTMPSTREARPIGSRALSKQESQHKIMIAARELFAELGYERATLRQIAARAGLTVGALFNHVTDKRDLIYLIFNAQVDGMIEVALAAPRTYQTFPAKVLSITEHYYRLFASDPVLSRILLTEVVALAPGVHFKRYSKIRARFINRLEELIIQAQNAGEIESNEDSELLARHIFFTYASAVRWWLSSSERPEWRDGHQEYERLLMLQMNGLRCVESRQAIAEETQPATGTSHR